MDPSALQGAHIRFLDTHLALIHIPLNLYPVFLQPILQLLLVAEERPKSSESDQSTGLSSDEHQFCNVSVTPIECSVVCSRDLANELFVPVRENLSADLRDQVSFTSDDFIVMQVDGEGLDAGQRVLELTSPLAMAGISIFFITTYFSDYILVPYRSRGTVIAALEDRGFAFERHTSTYTNTHHHINGHSLHGRNRSSTSSFESLIAQSSPDTPPPTTVSELQLRTFATLARNGVQPLVDPSLRLIHCAGSKDYTNSALRGLGGGGGTMMRGGGGFPSPWDSALHLGIVKCLIQQPHPPFLALTLTDTEPPSLLLAHTLLCNFAASPSDPSMPPPTIITATSSSHHSSPPSSLLLGAKDEYLIPITLDLRGLPFESTGIVCGVAGRLVGSTKRGALDAAVEMSYLSTARGGTVMVAEEELKRALGALRGVGESEDVPVED